MKQIKKGLILFGFILISIHTFALVFKIDKFSLKFANFQFSYDDNIYGIYFGLTLVIISILLNILDKKSLNKEEKKNELSLWEELD